MLPDPLPAPSATGAPLLTGLGFGRLSPTLLFTPTGTTASSGLGAGCCSVSSPGWGGISGGWEWESSPLPTHPSSPRFKVRTPTLSAQICPCASPSQFQAEGFAYKDV